MKRLFGFGANKYLFDVSCVVTESQLKTPPLQGEASQSAS
jgi:hypothetical protein